MIRKQVVLKTFTIIVLLLIGIIFGEKEVNAYTNHTQTEAVNWVTDKGNIKWNDDVDGQWGCQCVDLIYAYYNYLVGYNVGGNAYQYADNKLPDGWTRVYSNPRKGDIVVWSPGVAMGWEPLQEAYANSTNGHIGIVWQVNASGTISTIETNSRVPYASYYERYTNNIACYIRPDFNTFPLTNINNIGDNVYCCLIINDAWLHLADQDGKVVLENPARKANQIWNFVRQSDGSYTIRNCATNNYLDVYGKNDYDGTVIQTYPYNGSTAQKFDIYGPWSGEFILKPKCSADKVLDIYGGKNLVGDKANLWTYNGSTAQKFALYTAEIAKSSHLTYNVSDSKVRFNWVAGENIDNYNLRIKSGTQGNTKTYKEILGIKNTSYNIDLPNGYYEAYIDSNNFFSCASSNVVKFYVNKKQSQSQNSNQNQDLLPFKDISKNDWYYDAVKYAYNNKMISGYNTTTFAPNDKLTRGMIVTILYRMEGSPKNDGKSDFTDVNLNQYYAKAVKWASNAGVIHGYAKTKKFGPNNNILRQDLVSILRNYAKYKEKNVNVSSNLSKFSDYREIDDYANASMRWAVSKGVITGNKNRTLSPKGYATRAESAAMIQKYCQNVGR